MKPQALGSQQASQCSVQGTFPVRGIANDRVRDVFEVASELMATASQGLEFNQSAAGGGIRAGHQGQFIALKAAEVGLSRLRRQAIGSVIISHATQRVIYQALSDWPAAHNRKVGLVNITTCGICSDKRPADLARGICIQGKQQNTAGTLVESVDRPNGLAKLVSDGLQGKTGLCCIQPGLVHQQSGRFVHSHEIIVPV